MLISFTQTYGNRSLLLDIYSRDKRLIEFKNLFDLNIYSFHNVDQNIIDKFKKINKVNNTKELYFYNMSYPKTIQALKQILKQENCTHFFFSQDDTFSYNNENIDFTEFLDYVKQHKNNFLVCLSKKFNEKYPNKKADIKNTFSVYKYTSIDLVNLGIWSFDDTAYICSYDLIDTIYDDNYFKELDIWRAEIYLKNKFRNTIIQRNVLDKILFKNYNILGKSIEKREKYLINLREKKLI